MRLAVSDLRFAQGGGLFGVVVAGVEEQKEDAAEGEFAAGGVVPLFERVDAAAGAAGSDGEGGDAEREREIGVGGADAGFGLEVEVAVDGAEADGECGVGRQRVPAMRLPMRRTVIRRDSRWR